ncbi:interleukin-17 receptor C isoform X1 [Acanthochromis polyacanthus]|uniref:interleukin-17 receptor C isoform X1 n=1 Tax=Acanthochromis polyacanthus TaxID=80966 RepID=UPI0022346294|nr:interleukin-17 receptor C isoform X1 [Acanthochromis polyacanthus]
MALPLQRMPHVVSLLFLLLHFWTLVSSGELEMIHRDAPDLSCSEGLTDCNVSSGYQFCAARTDPSVNVAEVQLEVVLCCPARQDCTLCLQIIITILQEVDRAVDVSGESGDDSDEKACVKVVLSSPGAEEVCKALWFKPNYSSLAHPSEQSTHKLLLTEKVEFGSPVVVLAYSEETQHIQNITIPSLKEVCSMKRDWAVKECNVPKLRVATDQKTNVVFLQLENTDTRQDELMWQMVWNGNPGEVLVWPKGKTEMVIPSNYIAPCLCFKVWWKRKMELQREYCPFKNQHDALERMQHNVSVSVVESWSRTGEAELSWNVTAPCRLEAEVWLCKKNLARDQCEEVMGSRQRLQAGWNAARSGHWQTGEFNVSSHPLLCVQLNIKGMKSHLEPQCPFTPSRSRWSVPLLIGLFLISLTILGAYIIQGILKGYVWKWLKEDDVKGAVGGGHVVLLYSPDDDQGLPELLCHLGSSLQALGFSVSLDLWSQAELSMLGPVPWLHSRLDQLQRQGGKVVLVLTRATWTRAEEWGARSSERNTPGERSRSKEEEEVGRSYAASSPCSDVFSASLSCILADYLQGRAGERFMLVQFESLPPELPGSFRPLPQLFRGLHVYSLPSQSLGFLTELAGAQQMTTAAARRKRAGGLRMASRALAQRLSGFTAGTNVLRLAGMSQNCVGLEDSGETVPLQPYLITPPSSPDTNPKVNEMEWV